MSTRDPRTGKFVKSNDQLSAPAVRDPKTGRFVKEMKHYRLLPSDDTPEAQQRVDDFIAFARAPNQAVVALNAEPVTNIIDVKKAIYFVNASSVVWIEDPRPRPWWKFWGS